MATADLQLFLRGCYYAPCIPEKHHFTHRWTSSHFVLECSKCGRQGNVPITTLSTATTEEEFIEKCRMSMAKKVN